MQVESRLRLHAYPVLGDVELSKLARRPSTLQQWLRGLEADLSPSTIRGIASTVSQVFSAAVDDQLIVRNPMAVRSVRPPKAIKPKVVPWTLDQVEAMADAVPARHGALVVLGAGCGLRQGELFGLALDDVDFLRQVVHVRRQVRLIDGELVFSMPKGGKERDVPLAEPVAVALAEHIRVHGTVEVTLPWGTSTGTPVSAELLYTNADAGALDRNHFNRSWRQARRAAGIDDTRENGTPPSVTPSPASPAGRGGRRPDRRRVPRTCRPGLHAAHVRAPDARRGRPCSCRDRCVLRPECPRCAPSRAALGVRPVQRPTM